MKSRYKTYICEIDELDYDERDMSEEDLKTMSIAEWLVYNCCEKFQRFHIKEVCGLVKSEDEDPGLYIRIAFKYRDCTIDCYYHVCWSNYNSPYHYIEDSELLIYTIKYNDNKGIV